MKKGGLLFGLLILGFLFSVSGCGDDEDSLPAACELMCKANEKCAQEEEALFSISACKRTCNENYEAVVMADCLKEFNEHVDCVYKEWGSSCDFDEEDLADIYDECEDEIEDFYDCMDDAEDMPF